MNSFSYKGSNKDKNYFEGWYVKLVDEDRHLSYAIIFGISLYEKDPHSFIQIVNSQTEKSDYVRFEVKDFSYSDFSIKIKDNVISPYRVKVNLKNLDIDVVVEDFISLDKNQLIPGVMGLFKYLPLCTKYEVIYLQGKANGRVIFDDEEFEFHGLSYMEKNWGNKFPSKWIWAETNNFDIKNIQLVFVYTELFSNMHAFLCILNIKGIEYRFASYNMSCIDMIDISNDTIMVNITRGKLKLNLRINYNHDCPIIAPIQDGRMHKIIGHSLNSTIFLSLKQDETTIYEGEATNVGCENTFIND